jgi:hypothetical protein
MLNRIKQRLEPVAQQVRKHLVLSIAVPASVLGVLLGLFVSGVLDGAGSMTMRVSLITQNTSGCVVAGDRVAIVSPSDTVVGTETWQENVKAENSLNNSSEGRRMQHMANTLNGLLGTDLSGTFDIYNFTVTVPSGLSRYGVRWDGQTKWVSASQARHRPWLQCT